MSNSTTTAKLSLSIAAYLLCTWQCSTNSLSLLKIYPEAGCLVFISGEAFLRSVLWPSSGDADEICFLALSVFGLVWTLPVVVGFARCHLSKFLVIVWSSAFSLQIVMDSQLQLCWELIGGDFSMKYIT